MGNFDPAISDYSQAIASEKSPIPDLIKFEYFHRGQAFEGKGDLNSAGPRGIGPTHNGREAVEGSALQTKFGEHRVKGARLATMAPKDALDVEWRCAETFGDCWNLRCPHKEEYGIGIDKASYEPRASNAVYLRALSRDPHRVAFAVPQW